MAALKTKQTEANVEDFINSYADTVGKFKMGKGCIYVRKIRGH